MWFILYKEGEFLHQMVFSGNIKETKGEYGISAKHFLNPTLTR